MYKTYTKDYNNSNNPIVQPLIHLVDTQLVANANYRDEEKKKCD